MLTKISTLLAAGWTDLFPETDEKYGWMNSIFGTISIVLYIIMGVVGAAGAVYAIYLGIQLARADEQSKRDDAKKHLITVLIAVAVTIVLVLFFNLLLPLIVKAFIGPSISDPDGSMTGEEGKSMISALKMFIR